MDRMVIVGGKKLAGEVRISGAKNAALPILASSLLVEGWNTFHNIPDLLDIKTIKKLPRRRFELGRGARDQRPFHRHRDRERRT